MSATSPRPFRARRQTIVEGRYQWGFVLQVFAAQFIAILGFQAAVQLRITKRLAEVDDFATEQILRGLFSDVFFTLLVIGPIMGILVALLALRLSHRVVGPVPKLRSGLQALAEGEYTTRIQFRPGDALEGTDVVFNAMAEALESRHGSNGDPSNGSQKSDDAEFEVPVAAV